MRVAAVGSAGTEPALSTLWVGSGVPRYPGVAQSRIARSMERSASSIVHSHERM
jgi:hypothetical protein